MKHRISIIKAILPLILISISAGENPELKSLTINRAEAKPVIDGDLTESLWETAASVTHFLEIEPGENVQPPVETEVKVTYDEDHLYVAFLAYGNPEDVRATYGNRDEVFADDFVAIILDPFGDSNAGIMLASNPYGIQLDTKNTGGRNGDDLGFDVVYHTQGKITDDGFQVEMSIPFSSLSFPVQEEQEWRVGFYRSFPRENRHHISWGGMDRTNPCWLCQLGYLRGMKGIKKKQVLELLPAVVGSQSFSPDSLNTMQSNPAEGEPSLGIRYSFSSDLSTEFTLNPDFSQVEADADQIDVNTTYALFFPEKRPFFNEGADLFKTYINAVYTRSINDPIAAGRIISRFGKTTVGFLSALDKTSPYTVPGEEKSYSAIGGQSISNIFRAKHSLGQTGFFGVLLTDRRMQDGGSGSLAGFDFRYRFNKTYSAELQVLMSSTEEPNDSLLSDSDTFGDGYSVAFDGESFSGNAVEFEFGRTTKHLHLEVQYEQKTPEFRADNGFVTKNNYRQFGLIGRLQFWPNNRILANYSIGSRASVYENFSGELKSKEVRIWTNFTLPRQTNLEVDFEIIPFERFKSTDMKDLWGVDVNIHSRFTESLMLGMGTGTGENMVRYLDIPERGKGTYYYTWMQLKLTQKFSIHSMYSYSEMKTNEGDSTYYSGFNSRVRVNYQFSKALSFRIFTQYSDFSKELQFQPLISYRPSPFTIFYIGSTHGYDVTGDFEKTDESSRQIFMKFQYLFDV